MINNNAGDILNRFFNNRAANGQSGNAADMYRRLQERRKTMMEKADPDAEAAKAAAAEEESDTVETSASGKAAKEGEGAAARQGGEKQSKKSDADLSPQERRKMELQAILDKINREEGERRGGAAETREKSNIVTVEDKDGNMKSSGGVTDFLNDLPLFNEFKSGLIDAFKSLDGNAAGGINAQYELNYTTMQYVANAAGGFEYKEASLTVKIDMTYMKAAGGSTKEIVDALSGATDFNSLVSALSKHQTPADRQTIPGEIKSEDFIASLKDYFSPEKTADRIVDFATAFFPLSNQYKQGGDTEETREAFAEIMRKAIQKGFDQAMGTLGKVPKNVQDGIDKTHELTFKGIDDFVKNGMDRKKEQQGVYASLQELVFSAQVNYSEKTVAYKPVGYEDQKQAAKVSTEA